MAAGRLAGIPLAKPSGVAQALSIVISGSDVGEGERQTLQERLLAGGSVVLQIDLDAYRKALNADNGECLYLDGELADLAQQALKTSGTSTYLRPVVIGVGEAATMAYAALAQVPFNTFAGGISIRFANALKTRLPFCPGAQATPLANDGGFSYGADKPLVSPARFISAATNPDADAIAVARPEATATVSPDWIEETVNAALEMARDDASQTDGLPLTVIEPAGVPKGLAVIWSGDGGWRDIDKEIGEKMASDGYGVVGLDTLRYFWSEKDPKQFGADLARIVARYLARWDLHDTTLVGYSFGADTLPFAWQYLPAGIQSSVRAIVLLSPETSTGFSISVTGWLGLQSGDHDVVDAVAKLPAGKVHCLYGKDEDDSACTSPALSKTNVLALDGGHHFDGDYERLARTIERFGTP
ncbi:MAG: virulence factor family protein [Flavobacteriaceae bacterium]